MPDMEMLEKLAYMFKRFRMEEIAVRLGVSYQCVAKWKYGKVKKLNRLTLRRLEEVYRELTAEKQ